MRFRRWWGTVNFKYKVFVFMAAVVTATVSLVEVVFEPLVEGNFDLSGADIDWHEVPVWVFMVIMQGIVCASLITRMIMRRLNRLAEVTEQIASGDLSARLSEGENPNDAFNKLSHRFNIMADTVERLLVNEKRLLSDISHELRSPLSRISAAVELMAIKNGENENAHHLRRIENEIGHMSRMIGVLLEQGKNSLSIRDDRETVDLSGLAEDLAEGFRMQGEANRKRLAVSIALGMQVSGTQMQLRLIMENIVGNALFYTPPDTIIDFSVQPVGRMVGIVVRDRGPGVPENQLQDIFRAFYRVDSSRARLSGGVGLGLTLAKEAATALGGGVEARNCEPGLEVTVLLPRMEV